MRKKKRINFKLVLAVLAVAALLMLPTQALSAKDKGIPPTDPGDVVSDTPSDDLCADPAGDFDNDGFTNEQECMGIVANQNGAYLTYPSCFDTQVPRAECLDPKDKDLFVILIPLQPGSLIPESPPDPLQYINSPKFDASGALTGHLGITTHLVPDSLPSRYVTSTQKALRVTESKLLTGILGSSFDTNVPLLGKDDAKIYTYQIREFVNAQFPEGGDHPEIWEPFIWHTIAHEIGHGIKLYIKYTARFDGWHLKPEYGKIMEESIKVQGTEFFISDQFDVTSVEGFQLIEAPL